MIFEVGDTVVWVSQAQGRPKVKVGDVVAVVPAGVALSLATLRRLLGKDYADRYGTQNLTLLAQRDYRSYLVAVPGGKTAKAKPRLYWPLPGKLEAV